MWTMRTCSSIRMLTFLPLEEIEAMDNWEGAQLNKAKEILAYELTALVHGKEEAEQGTAPPPREIFTSWRCGCQHADHHCHNHVTH